jgi:hypothetical protein
MHARHIAPHFLQFSVAPFPQLRHAGKSAAIDLLCVGICDVAPPPPLKRGGIGAFIAFDDAMIYS